MKSDNASEEIAKYCSNNNLVKLLTTYRLRDWGYPVRDIGVALYPFIIMMMA